MKGGYSCGLFGGRSADDGDSFTPLSERHGGYAVPKRRLQTDYTQRCVGDEEIER